MSIGTPGPRLAVNPRDLEQTVCGTAEMPTVGGDQARNWHNVPGTPVGKRQQTQGWEEDSQVQEGTVPRLRILQEREYAGHSQKRKAHTCVGVMAGNRPNLVLLSGRLREVGQGLRNDRPTPQEDLDDATVLGRSRALCLGQASRWKASGPAPSLQRHQQFRGNQRCSVCCVLGGADGEQCLTRPGRAGHREATTKDHSKISSEGRTIQESSAKGSENVKRQNLASFTKLRKWVRTTCGGPGGIHEPPAPGVKPAYGTPRPWSGTDLGSTQLHVGRSRSRQSWSPTSI